MTIGRPSPPPDQPDFKVCCLAFIANIVQLMAELRKTVCEKLGLQHGDVELSMGMSSDYKIAVCECCCCNALIVALD